MTMILSSQPESDPDEADSKPANGRHTKEPPERGSSGVRGKRGIP